MIEYVVIYIIKVYQKTISPDHGIFKHLHAFGFCRFHPTCSNYAIDAISKYGIVKGGVKALYRIIRCNPFNKGGNDPVK
ncbi:membrane protein insertion efficiency factor YidD [Patescibacteria group bacterium]|nr:membrane protein insertion efficiency factor YidD [Patescibacteria group bacterium]